MSRSILSVLVFTLSLACVGAETSDDSGGYATADPGTGKSVFWYPGM